MTNAIQRRDLPALSLRAAVEPATLDAEKRTVRVTWTTGARVLRGFFEKFYEELSLDPKHVRMERLNAGAPLLNAHNGWDAAGVIGVVEPGTAKVGTRKGTATVRFAKPQDDPEADKIFRKVKDGVITAVSVGYRIHKLEKIEDAVDQVPVYRAVDWEPFEISVVPMGADAGAGFRGAEDRPTNSCIFITEEERIMDPEKTEATSPEVLAERERAAGIQSLVKRAKLEATFADELVNRGVSLDQARALVLDRLATVSDAQPPFSNHIREGGGYAGNADGEARRRIGLMADGLAARFAGQKVSDEARPYAGMRVRDMARELLEFRGVHTRGWGDAQLISRAAFHTTSDFPILVGETGNRVLQAAYAAAPAGVRMIARQSSAPDFRAKTVAKVGEAPALALVNEAGEFTRGTIKEAKESYSLATYGKVFAITRKALVNDDLGGFTDLTVKLGRAAAEFVAAQIVSVLYGATGVGPTMTDGVALFNASHGNLGTAGVISDTTLTEALKLMRLQKGIDGATPIAASPRYLVVPAALEVLARKSVAAINAAQTANVNVFAGALEVLVDPRLDAKSATGWYVASDPAALAGIEYSYLDGVPGPEFETRVGFDVDGIEAKVRLDFGVGVVDHRGVVRNAGA